MLPKFVRKYVPNFRRRFCFEKLALIVDEKVINEPLTEACDKDYYCAQEPGSNGQTWCCKEVRFSSAP